MAVTRSQSGAQSKKKKITTSTPAAKSRKGAKSATKAKPAVFKVEPVASRVVKKAKKVTKKVKAAAEAAAEAAAKATTESTAKAQEAASEKAAVSKGQSPPAPSPKKPTRTRPKLVTMEELHDDERSLVDGIRSAGRKLAETKPWKPVASRLRIVEPEPQKPEWWSETPQWGSPKGARRSPNKPAFSPVSHRNSGLPLDPFAHSHITVQRHLTKHWGTPSAPPENHDGPTSPEYTKKSPTNYRGTLCALPDIDALPKTSKD
ncbi:hypothetical protein W97_01206 [Coniosporium apollinis CBS 100218]|uniref:Uncharacterized protein n=1 Tax=Coniosporium apollinis (strain CBS 100218) TaxID=1168221 RepID=R7YJD3_CONA1|nr:uncharacterized protein W97_01206 [Coniosporium apollinis CBS 100218]EON61988.1 hypothetical protein W97_01206 [Coniosporium apollinis CBS 100218]